jgi:hypothetical protein
MAWIKPNTKSTPGFCSSKSYEEKTKGRENIAE